MDSDFRTQAIRNRVAADQAALTTGRKGDDPVVDAKSLRATQHVTSRQRRAGALCRDRLASLAFTIDRYELLAGRIKPLPRDAGTLQEARDFLASVPAPGGQTGHCELAYDDLFTLGIDGLRLKIEERRAQQGGEKAETYHSFMDALAGLSAMIENAALPIENALAGASSERSAELTEMLESCRRIAHEPPRTFLDGIHLTWFTQIGVMIGNSVGLVSAGHLDRRLNAFYEADIASGQLTRQRALELIEGLYFLTNDFQSSGAAYAVMVGGRNADGQDVTNELSHLCLEAVRRTNLVYPTVGVCWHEGTPDTLTDLAIELISDGHTTPAFFNDTVIQNGLKHYGVPGPEACDYINSTCVEITTCGSSNIWVASPYYSLCGILMEHLAELAASGAAPRSYDAFVTSYLARLGEEIANAARAGNESRERRRLYGRKPLQSAFTHDCIERGRDIDDGGARYNWVECSFVGLANLVDSLKVIREEVFQSENLTLAALKAILDRNFDGHEPLRQKFVNHHPKYGVNDASVDAEIKRVMKVITSECAKHKMAPDNAHFIPGTFCWVMHQRLGAACGATPDGRMAWSPFADGAGPAQGRETRGPTAAIQSVTSWDHTPMIGGSAFNMKFTRSLVASPQGVGKLKNLVLTFLRQGGFETQINVVDNSVLEKALADPEAYSDLVVRIGGYTDYFTRLDPLMQREVLQRTEYTAL